MNYLLFLLRTKSKINLINHLSTAIRKLRYILISTQLNEQYQNYLNASDGIETSYLTNKLKVKSIEIERIFNSISDKIPVSFINRLKELVNKVIEHQIVFSDIELNNWLNEVILYINNTYI